MSQPGFRAIMQKIVEALWVVIEQDYWPIFPNQPLLQCHLSNIFRPGENFFKVESPDINNNYEFNAAQTCL